MATFSGSLLLALEQSVNSPNQHDPHATSTTVQKIQHDPQDYRVHHLSDGLDDDLYLHDEEHHPYPQK